MWYNWNHYFSYLCMDYHMNPFYFNRFYRNTEPLITPEMLKLTLRKPIQQSSEMLRSIDRLEAMLRDAREGNPVNKAALMEQSKKVRELAKQIRKNQTVSIIDLRDDKDLYKVDKENSLSPEALEKLREMALDIDRQLRNLYSQSTTSTVSVENYQEPSLESLAKGIERICKSIENSSKRL